MGGDGAPPDPCAAHTGVFQEMAKLECHFINGTEQVRYMERHIYNREQLVHFDSDVGVFVGDTPFGEIQARHWNSDPEVMEYRRSVVDTVCQNWYNIPFLLNRR
ncbi:class II histocompatibility antigen, B-L beta chain-like, partial [Neopelma chrysocephalum]|uniref:class II histocompatibility antigen, B-L beta chain-like n=1 Tax=Neopelma chrysocephalum TaxID=114329 RepID=UPI000FCCF106